MKLLVREKEHGVIPYRRCLTGLAQSDFQCSVSAGQDVVDRGRDGVVGANSVRSLRGSVDRHVIADQLHRQNQPGVRKHHGSVGIVRLRVRRIAFGVTTSAISATRCR